MVNIMNLFDRILNEQIVNVLFVRQLVIKLVSLVYSITIMICVLIDTRLCVHVVLMSISISFLFFFSFMANLFNKKKQLLCKNAFALYDIDDRTITLIRQVKLVA